MAYWSIADDDSPTYHTCKNCPSGKRILPGNQRNGTQPAGREKCAICQRYENNGVCT